MTDLTPEEKQRIYLEEKARIEAQEQIHAEMNQTRANAEAAARQACSHGGGYDWFQSPPQSQKRSGPNMVQVFGVIVLVSAVIIFGAIAAFNVFTGSSSSDSQSQSSEASPQVPSVLAIGDDGTLTLGDSSEVIVAATESDENDLTNAVAAKDKVGYSQIANSDRAFFVSGGTRAKLIGYGSGFAGGGVYHIRIEGGPRDAQDGWIPQEWMKK